MFSVFSHGFIRSFPFQSAENHLTITGPSPNDNPTTSLLCVKQQNDGIERYANGSMNY